MPNTIKHYLVHQTFCHFHQTCLTKHRSNNWYKLLSKRTYNVRKPSSNIKKSPIKHENKRNALNVWSHVWWLSNFIKHDQTRSNSTKQGVQTVKCLIWSSTNVWWCLAAKHFPFVQGFKNWKVNRPIPISFPAMMFILPDGLWSSFVLIPFSLYIFPHIPASSLWPALLNHSPSDSILHSMQKQLPWNKISTMYITKVFLTVLLHRWRWYNTDRTVGVVHHIITNTSKDCTATAILPAASRKKNVPESHTINPLLTKLVRSRWLLDLDSVLVHKHAWKELG